MASRDIELFGQVAAARLTLEGGEVLSFEVNGLIVGEASRHAPAPVPVFDDDGNPVVDDDGNVEFAPDDSTLIDVAAELALAYLCVYRPDHPLAGADRRRMKEAMRPPCRLRRVLDFDEEGEVGLLDPLAPSA